MAVNRHTLDETDTRTAVEESVQRKNRVMISFEEEDDNFTQTLFENRGNVHNMSTPTIEKSTRVLAFFSIFFFMNKTLNHIGTSQN